MYFPNDLLPSRGDEKPGAIPTTRRTRALPRLPGQHLLERDRLGTAVRRPQAHVLPGVVLRDVELCLIEARRLVGDRVIDLEAVAPPRRAPNER